MSSYSTGIVHNVFCLYTRRYHLSTFVDKCSKNTQEVLYSINIQNVPSETNNLEVTSLPFRGKAYHVNTHSSMIKKNMFYWSGIIKKARWDPSFFQPEVVQ